MSTFTCADAASGAISSVAMTTIAFAELHLPDDRTFTLFSLLRVAHAAMTCASGCAPRRVAAIGAAEDHGLAHLAACCLDLAAGVADFPARRALRIHGICFRFARLIANGFFRTRKRQENKK